MVTTSCEAQRKLKGYLLKHYNRHIEYIYHRSSYDTSNVHL